MTKRLVGRGTGVVVLFVVVALTGVGSVAARGVAGPRISSAPTWSVTPSPSPFTPSVVPLSGVSCSSPTSCFAVGTRSDPIVYPGVSRHAPTGLVVERWDGTTWSAMVAPTGTDRGGARLHGVSCPSATSCFAVGELGDTVNTKTFVEGWDGTSWTIVASPNPTDAVSARLDGISCWTNTDCFAVGTYSTESKSFTLIEQWDGESWTIAASPSPSAAVGAHLSGVSCVSDTSCFAVGGHAETGVNKGSALAESWDGTSWTIVPTPTPIVRPIASPFTTPTLAGVSCTSAMSCFAVGYTTSDALIERWDGTRWALVASPAPRVHSGIAELGGVSCSSATNCSAVGVAFDTSRVSQDGPPNSIAMHWDGSAWTIAARPPGVPVNKSAMNGLAQLSELRGVSCPAATSCAAVGDSAVVEHWDGSTWSLAPLAASTSYSYLNQVTCPSATSCFAVGTAQAFLDESTNTLVERWDGTGWSVVPSPTPTGINVQAALTSISCPSPTNCTAVGSYFALSALDPNRGSGKPLIEHWNGTSWSLVASPKPPNAGTLWSLSSVSCASATDCNAVGAYAQHLLAEHWNGTRWSIVPMPSPSGASLNAVSCSSASNCFAVGFRNNTKSSGAGVIERWNGKIWSTVPTPKPKGGTFNQLNGVSCRSTVDCTAVGFNEASTFVSSTEKTLVEHWNGKSWSTVPSPKPSTSGGVTLSGVSCSSATSCTAVGRYGGAYFDDRANKPLIEEWNGSRWSVVSSALPTGAIGGFLNGVNCASSTTCVAAGGQSAHDGLLTLVEQRT